MKPGYSDLVPHAYAAKGTSVLSDQLSRQVINNEDYSQLKLPFAQESGLMTASMTIESDLGVADPRDTLEMEQKLDLELAHMSAPELGQEREPKFEEGNFHQGNCIPESFGQRLGAARERLGWSREEVALRLKLPIKLVGRLESDDYHGIAHAVYLRGYLISYARLVGVPEVLADEVVIKKAEHPPLITTGTISRSRYLVNRYSMSATYLILTGLIVAPTVWLASHGGLEQDLVQTIPLDAPLVVADRRGVSPSAEIVVAADVSAANLAVNKDPSTSTNVAVASDPAPVVASMAPFPTVHSPLSTAPVNVALPGSHTLKLSLSEASWVEILSTRNGERLQYGILPAGVERSYSSSDVLSVRIGNVKGVRVEADGQILDLTAFQHSNVAHFKAFADVSGASRVNF